MKFTKPFTGCKAGEIYPTEFRAGDECPEELHDAAKSLGAVDPPIEAPKARKGVTENK